MFDGELRQLAAGLTDLKGLSDTGDCAGVRRLQAPREFRARRIRTKGVPEVGVSSVRQKDSPNGNVDSSAESADRTRVQPAGVESTKISVLNSAWHCASLSKLKRFISYSDMFVTARDLSAAGRRSSVLRRSRCGRAPLLRSPLPP